MPQTILNFNLESTYEKLTPRTGIAIIGEYLKGMNLEMRYTGNIEYQRWFSFVILSFYIEKTSLLS